MAWKALLYAALLFGGVATLVYLRPQYYSALFGERDVEISVDTAYGIDPRQKLDVYTAPEGSPDANPIIVFLYGGSWSSGDKALYGFVGRALASRGFTTVIPDYRLYPEVTFPKFFEDAANAYVWVENNLARRCSPARPIILIGHSAGAHMAAMLAFNPEYIKHVDANAPRPAAFIGLAGPYTFEPTQWPTTKDAFSTASKTPEITRPITFVTKVAPPSLLLQGLADATVALKNLDELSAALRGAGVHVETEIYPDVGHAGLVLTLSRPLRWRAPTLARITQFARGIGKAAKKTSVCK